MKLTFETTPSDPNSLLLLLSFLAFLALLGFLYLNNDKQKSHFKGKIEAKANAEWESDTL
jgi:hypothetical protein